MEIRWRRERRSERGGIGVWEGRRGKAISPVRTKILRIRAPTVSSEIFRDPTFVDPVLLIAIPSLEIIAPPIKK
jgi:hypothetical protein